MVKFLKPNKVVILLQGRYAGRKAVIVKAFEEGTRDRPYGHCLVTGIGKYLKKDLKDVVNTDSLQSRDKKANVVKEIKGRLEERFKTGKIGGLLLSLVGAEEENKVEFGDTEAQAVQTAPSESASEEQVSEIEKARSEGTTTKSCNPTPLEGKMVVEIDKGHYESSVDHLFEGNLPNGDKGRNSHQVPIIIVPLRDISASESLVTITPTEGVDDDEVPMTLVFKRSIGSSSSEKSKDREKKKDNDFEDKVVELDSGENEPEVEDTLPVKRKSRKEAMRKGKSV
ncbi:hypothetical protein RND71_028502 [Anisodus tanguticus]|uniref:60S ribosomal protein L27 n=1 Tax=Anisodus tanguticus TaxID=243964 RepID=A0AAE1RKV0_9SOLA|nr:hypothetical protein RND71_028502 [Anisodus tanguticus]